MKNTGREKKKKKKTGKGFVSDFTLYLTSKLKVLMKPMKFTLGEIREKNKDIEVPDLQMNTTLHWPSLKMNVQF